MEYNHWYDEYQQNGSQQQAQKPHRGVSIPALIACMLITALLGGALGGFLVHASIGDVENQAAALPEATGQPVLTAPEAVEKDGTAAVQNSVSSLLTQGAAGGSFTRAQIVEVGAPSVVGIDVEFTSQSNYGSGFDYFFGYGNGGSGSQVQTGSGSGVIITADGYIVTCNHVVEGASKITVILSDETSHEAKIVGTDSRNDLAVIKIEASGLTPATLGDSDMLTVGEDVVAIGNPLGELRGTSTGGMVSALGRQVTVEGTEMTLIQHDAAVSPGSSGGGLFNSSGSLIGIVNAKASSNNAEGIGFAIPVNSVKQIISDLIEHGYVKGRAYLGILSQNVTLRAEQGGWGGYFGHGGTSCVQVGQVVAGSAAEAAGIQAGDLILAVGEEQITSTDALSKAIGAYNAGDQATLTIQRNGQQMQVDVTFGEYTPEN
ncbi:MAG: trypsin-like peptidase domain-containing protein [bacterium]|nr:trypsin-like peptidase domain-containing protein [bacterium]